MITFLHGMPGIGKTSALKQGVVSFIPEMVWMPFIDSTQQMQFMCSSVGTSFLAIQKTISLLANLQSKSVWSDGSLCNILLYNLLHDTNTFLTNDQLFSKVVEYSHMFFQTLAQQYGDVNVVILTWKCKTYNIILRRLQARGTPDSNVYNATTLHNINTLFTKWGEALQNQCGLKYYTVRIINISPTETYDIKNNTICEWNPL